MGSRNFTLTVAALLMAGILIQLCQPCLAEINEWESNVATMKRGANLMIEAGKTMQGKKDLGSSEKMIKDGHRMMMEAEKAAARIQKDTMKRGANMMIEGFKILKDKNNSEEAEKLMGHGQQLILEAEKMMADERIAKLMLGSRTMMRGLRMLQKTDANTADKLMTDGQRLMTQGQMK